MTAANPYAYYRKQSHGFEKSFGIDIHEKAGSLELKAFLGQFKHFLCGYDSNGYLWFKPEAAGLEGKIEQLKHLYGYFFSEYEQFINVGYFNKERLPKDLVALFQKTFDYQKSSSNELAPQSLYPKNFLKKTATKAKDYFGKLVFGKEEPSKEKLKKQAPIPDDILKNIELLMEEANKKEKFQRTSVMMQHTQEQYDKLSQIINPDKEIIARKDKIRNFIAQVKGNLDFVDLRKGKEVIATPAKMLIETLRYEKSPEATDWYTRVQYLDEAGKEIAATLAKEVEVESNKPAKDQQQNQQETGNTFTTAQEDLKEKFHLHIKPEIDALSKRSIPEGLTPAVSKLLHKLCTIKQNSQHEGSWEKMVYDNAADHNELPFWTSKGAFLETVYNGRLN